MRTVVLYHLLSLDGVAEGPGDWFVDFGPEGLDNLGRVIASQSDVLLGRRTYDEWAPYWPSSDFGPFAPFINNTPKHVFTSSALAEPWSNSRAVSQPVVDYVGELRSGSGDDIGVHGSIQLSQALLRAGLMDVLDARVAVGTSVRYDIAMSSAEKRVLACAAGVHAANAALAEELVAFEASGEWQGPGIRSFGHWCDINLGLQSRPAMRLAAAAARLAELPLIRSAFAEGAISIEKMVAVAEVASAASDEKFEVIARTGSVSQVQRICAAYRRLDKEPSPEQDAERHARRGLTKTVLDDGLVRLVAVLEPDDAAVVLAAIDARVETAWRRHHPDTDRPAPELSVRRADALVELATDGLVEGPTPVVRGERVEVRVIVDADVLTGSRPDGICELDGIGAIPRTTVQRLLCDCNISVATRLPDGSLNVGRSQRTPNRRQRRALRHRDRGCRFYGCTNQRFVQAHHVQQWEEGGRTDMDNLISLCPEHHRLFHEGGYTIDALGNGQFTFRRPDGRSLAPPPLRAPPGAAPPVPGDPRAQGGGGHFDLAHTLDALLRVP